MEQNQEGTLVRINLEAVLIETTRPETLAEFYRQAFNLSEPTFDGEDHLGMDLGNTYLGFDRVSPQEQRASGPVQLWFRVNDVQPLFIRLLALGATVRYEPTSRKSPGELLAMLYDPDGNMIGLVSPLV
jgi:predicted enzyme related to lactoylglutathione lyase